MTDSYRDYGYNDAQSGWNSYLLPVIESEVRKIGPRNSFELGCGNGSVANWLGGMGYSILGVDLSESGIEVAKRQAANNDRVRFDVASVYDDLAARFGQFDLLISLEVVEHLYAPRDYAKRAFELLSPGGFLLLSTPYHGYWKNLALCVSGKMDAHFTALWDGGHIKFWSIPTITSLLEGAGFEIKRIHRVGRVPAFAKSMIVVAEKPMNLSQQKQKPHEY